MTKGQYSPVKLKLARLVSSSLYGTLTLNLTAFKNLKYMAYDCFYGNGLVWQNPNQQRTNQNTLINLETTLPCNKVTYSTAFCSYPFSKE